MGDELNDIWYDDGSDIISYHEVDDVDDYLRDDVDDADVLKAGKSMIADIDDRINREFIAGEIPVEVTAAGRFGRFRSIPDLD